MNNSFFTPIFQSIDTLKEKMRNCTSKEQWQQYKQEYKDIMANAYAVYEQYSNEDKYNAFVEREKSAIAAIYANVKQLWESMSVERELAERKPKQYEIYNQDNYEQDLADELEYMRNELFPTAIAEGIPDYQVYARYCYHLWNKPFYRQCGNPIIAFKNIMRRNWEAYRNEAKGIATPTTDEI